MSEEAANVAFAFLPGLSDRGAVRVQPVVELRPGTPLQDAQVFDYTVCFARDGRHDRLRCTGEPSLLDRALYRFALSRRGRLRPEGPLFEVDLSVLRSSTQVTRSTTAAQPLRVVLEPDYKRFGDEIYEDLVRAGIASWWGQGHHTDGKIPGLLDAANGTNFKWALYYEPEGSGNPAPSAIKSDLDYISAKYASNPNYLRVNGKPVMFVWDAGTTDSCTVVNRWNEANGGRFYVVQKVFSGYRTCAAQPDSWHQYGPASPADHQQGYSYNISPGFWHKMEGSARLARDLNRWNQNIRDMIASGAPWQLITSFNEWGEGTIVESAKEWETSSGFGAYLDALHNNGGATGSPAPATPIATAPAETPSATPITATPISTAPPQATQPPANGSGESVSIIAAGDIACQPDHEHFNEGEGATRACRQKHTADIVTAENPDAVLVLGDLQYDGGSLSDFKASYDLSWGKFKDKTLPIPGNHEYGTSKAAGYFDYFGSRAGDRDKGYYSSDQGAWQLVALNSNCSKIGGCGPDSAQYKWLKQTLEAGTTMCEVAMIHHPRWSSGNHGDNSEVQPLYDLLYQHGVDVVLSGHDHHYERFAPQDASGKRDDAKGMRQFISGAGGKNLYSLDSAKSNSEVREADTFGVLKMDLNDGNYEWKFLPEAGKTFTDAGKGSCH